MNNNPVRYNDPTGHQADSTNDKGSAKERSSDNPQNNTNECVETDGETKCEIYVPEILRESVDRVFDSMAWATIGLYAVGGFLVGGVVGAVIGGVVGWYEASAIWDIKEEVNTAIDNDKPVTIVSAPGKDLGFIVDGDGKVDANGNGYGTWVNTPLALFTLNIFVWATTGDTL